MSLGTTGTQIRRSRRTVGSVAGVVLTAALAVILSACGAGDNGGTIQSPPSTSGGSVSTTTSTTATGNTLPGGN